MPLILPDFAAKYKAGEWASWNIEKVEKIEAVNHY